MSTLSVEQCLPANAAPPRESARGAREFTDTQPAELTQRQAVMDLYDQVHPRLLAHLRSLGLTTEDAEDVANESFMRLMKHLAQSRGNENLRGWLFRVAYNLSMDVHRANKRYCCASAFDTEEGVFDIYDAVDPYPSPEVAMIERERSRNLRAAVMLLTLQQRECLLLRNQGLRYREIASALGITLQRAAALRERGVTRLRQLFEA